MIELQKVKRDIINYGALKVYTTFLTISEEEVDPELFAASQLKEIFEKKYDVLKVNISFVEGEPAEVVGTELLVFKLSKCSDNEISYMSNVDDEGKLSSLVLTKSGDEVSLEVVEYSVGGEEVPNVEEAPSGTIVDALGLGEDGKVVKGSLPSGGTKLYRHRITDLNAAGSDIYLADIVSTRSEPFDVNCESTNYFDLFVGDQIISACHQDIAHSDGIWALHFEKDGSNVSLIMDGSFSQGYIQKVSNFSDTVTELGDLIVNPPVHF